MIRLISDKVTAMLVFYVGQTESGWQEFIVRYTTLKVTQPAFHKCLCVYRWGFFCIIITYKIKVLLKVMLLFSGHTYSNLSLHPLHLFFSWFFFLIVCQCCESTGKHFFFLYLMCNQISSLSHWMCQMLILPSTHPPIFQRLIQLF